MIFIILISDFTKMPFEASVLTGVNCSVVSPKIFFSWHILVVLVATDTWAQAVHDLEL